MQKHLKSGYDIIMLHIQDYNYRIAQNFDVFDVFQLDRQYLTRQRVQVYNKRQ